MRHNVLTAVMVSLFLAVAADVGAAEKGGKAAGSREYAGSAACRKCHPTEFDSWKLTNHSRMLRKRDEGILKDVVEKWATDGFNPGPATGNVTGKRFSILDVQYVIGSKWKQRFLVKDESTGGYQFLNKQFNRLSGKWENYGNKNDWDTMCATCHTTGYRLTRYDAANPKTQKAEWVELNNGCENCHGPGARHAKSKSKKDIWTFAGKSKEVQARVCGYCHIRLENERYKSAQGNNREDFPAPKIGESFKPSDDWRTWYPDEVVIPGVQAKHPFDAEYKGDLKGLFIVDDVSRKNGVFEEGKHHEEYQGFIQSKHYKVGNMSCLDCHSPHAGKGKPMKNPAAQCANCHDSSYTYTRYMPGTGKTADNLYVRSHTFVKEQTRPGLPTFQGEPEYYY